MSNPRWSASRFSTYESCKTKYFLNYIKQLVVLNREADVTTKGLTFHQIAEQMSSDKSIDVLYGLAKKIIDESDFDKDKYPIIRAIPRFFLWWHTYVKKWEEGGYTLEREAWRHSTLDNRNLVGAMDLILTKGDEVIIIDFKTAQKANVAGYSDQLILYAYMVAKLLKIKDEDIPSKIKTYVFFPLSGLKDENQDDEESVKKFMDKTFKQLLFTKEEVDAVISKFKNIMQESDCTVWNNYDLTTNATMSYACSFCGFLGSQKFCPTSAANGFVFPRKAKIYQKDDPEQKDLK